MEKPIMRELQWESENVFKIDDITFVVMIGQELYTTESREKTFVIGKTRRQLETLGDLGFEKPVKRILDLGIYKGGSVMFYHKLFSPEKIIAIDLNPEPVEPLEDFIRQAGLGETIRTCYGVDQSDEKAVRGILRREMTGQSFDLVIDDASHLLRQTRASFNMIFPYVAPGGYYIIEDWGWAHWNTERWQKDGGVWPKETPMTNLIFEITMLLASRPDLVASVYLLPAYAVVKRGARKMDPESERFDISGAYLNRGRKVRLLD